MSRIREFEAAQACSVIVKMMNARSLDMTPRLLALRDGRFSDMVRIALEMLRAAGHEEDAKRIEAMPLRPYRYMKLTIRQASPEEMAKAERVLPS